MFIVNCQDFVADIRTVCTAEARAILNEPEMQQYLNLCMKLCLLMNATEPPVWLECRGWKPRAERQDVEVYRKCHRENVEPTKRHAYGRFERERYKDYTKRGKFCLYTVWPALLLHQSGSLLAKGVAQGTDLELDPECTLPWKWWK